MHNSRHDTLYKVAALCSLLLLAACSEPAAPPEQRVRDFVSQLEAEAEQREFTKLVEHIAGDYLDSRGNDKLKAAAVLRAFYLRYKSIHLHTRIADIRVPSPERASATIYVAMAQRPFPESGGLPDADFYRVDLELATEGDSYEILQSEWQRASAADLFF